MIITRRSAIATGLAALALPNVARAADIPVAMTAPGAVLGEGPLWCAGENCIYWVDIRGKFLHRLNLGDGRQDVWPTPGMIGWIIECERDTPLGGFLAGIDRSVYAVATSNSTPIFSHLFDIEADKPDNRLNDAKVDAQGRLWTGTMHMPFSQKTAALYRIDPDLSVHQMDPGYICTNGPAFNVAGTRLYHNETAEGIVYVFDLAADGSLANKRVFATFTHAEGYPDGMTTDTEDGLWVALNNGGAICRLNPDGSRDYMVTMPARQVTSLTFAGANLERMFVTTAAQPPVASDDPLAGTMFEVPASLLKGHKGLPTNLFKG